MKQGKTKLNPIGGILLTREEALEQICKSKGYRKYRRLTPQMQEELLDFLMGKRGIKITYDPFFKRIFDPVLHKERLSELLSLLIGEEVRVKQALPSESKRLSAEASLIIMDIIVELEDGGLANVEIQKVGYHFPGQRSACYSSDLLIRQYDRQRSRRKKKFTYRDLKKVYTLVLVEKSSREFHQISNTYLHHSKQVFDSGLELELLQEYIFIALDIFHEITHNINNKLEAWLLFLSTDELEDIVNLVSSYPEFEELYQELAEFQTKPEEVISMYNETLALMDKNTVELMIEEQREEIKKLDEEVRRKKAELKSRDKELKKKDKELKSREKELKSRDEELKSRDEELKSRDEELKSRDEELKTKDEELKRKDEELEQLRKELSKQ